MTITVNFMNDTPLRLINLSDDIGKGVVEASNQIDEMDTHPKEEIISWKITERPTTALQQLKNNRIFELEEVDLSGITVHKIVRCDDNHEMEVDKEFLLQLARELTEYAKDNFE